MIFKTNLVSESNPSIKKHHKEHDKHLADLNRLSSMFKEVIESSTSADSTTINPLRDRYKKLLSSHATYSKHLQSLFEEREIEKRDLFQTSLLNIKLDKFNGYTSTADIYTFRTNFEKLYLTTTPHDVLPDLLKNNFLTIFAVVKHTPSSKMSIQWKKYGGD